MTRRLVTGAIIGALAAVLSAGAVAQMKADPKSYVPGVAGCNTTNCGYWLSATGTPDNNVVKSGAYNGGAGLSGNLCWRTGYWAPSMAIERCDPDLVPKPAPVVAPPPPPPPKPAPPPPPPPAPVVQKITLASKALFDFDKAVLKPEGMAAIDSQVVGKLAQIRKLEVVLVTGHTDPLGTDAYNQKLSERRADAVRNYLVSKGIPKDKIETLGMGEKQPVAGVVCEQKNLKEKIACLAPDRRVEIQAKGETTR